MKRRRNSLASHEGFDSDQDDDDVEEEKFEQE